MIRKIVRIEFAEFGSEFFPERFVRVYLEGSHNVPDYEVSSEELIEMAFGC